MQKANRVQAGQVPQPAEQLLLQKLGARKEDPSTVEDTKCIANMKHMLDIVGH